MTNTLLNWGTTTPAYTESRLTDNDPDAVRYALQGEYLVRVTDPWQRNRVARGIRANDLMALRFAFPAS